MEISPLINLFEIKFLHSTSSMKHYWAYLEIKSLIFHKRLSDNKTKGRLQGRDF